jgi:hypothetical protein
MGYTHYWSWNFDSLKGKTKEYEDKYQQAILECQRVIRKLADENRSQYGSSWMSGYSAHTKPGQYAGILLNGSSGISAEDFVMREHLKQNESGFCKTNRQPYDDAVICCLLILNYRLGDVFQVSSDGDWEDWQPWADYVSETIKRKVRVPSSIRQPKTMRLLRA